MSRQFYFHIGLPKSATSFLQKNLFPLLDLDYLGKHYDSEVDHKSSSADFEKVFKRVFVLQPYNLSSEYVDGIYDELGDHDKTLYSNEDMAGSYAESFRNGYQIAHNLKHAFPEAKIIFVIRKQDDFIESLYRQAVRQGYWMSVAKFIGYKNSEFRDYRLNYKANVDLKTLNYSEWVEFYAGIFGRENLLVLPYEALKFHKEDFLNKLCRFLKVATKEPLRSSYENRSDSWLQLQVMRFFNLIFYKKVQNNLNRVFHFNKLMPLIGLRSIEKKFLSSGLRDEIRASVAAGNKQLSEKYHLNLDEYGYY